MVQIPKQQPAPVPAPDAPNSPPDSVPQGTPHSVPTSADVARLAGVSRATVSYVLNNTSAVRISEPTRRRVHAAAKELGYVPHAAARSLRAGHSRMVLMPTPQIAVGPLFSEFINELQWALSRFDYTVVQYGSLGLTGEEAARAWAELRPVAVLAPDAIALGARGVAVLKRSGAKAVFTLGPQRADGAHALLMDQCLVGRAAAAHLLAQGRRRIGVIVPEEPGLEAFSQPRLDGVRTAVRTVEGCSVAELPLAYTEDSAARLVDGWRSLGLDGVFAYNDEYAMLLMRALQDEGITVPDDIAVVGADDLMLARLLRPRLSSVRIELPSGRSLAELVDRVVREPGGRAEVHDVLGASVVHRESS
ncbi:LacI family DNA-binding transcriptional regulator [Streptomyces sp. LNU-CPARS28]|uniref:LacI family DNA-binding transcriptional regulator n=1 Tax=Streptomyces sp. LNU-CPARS28 TaxID=3137371 RepID=UPI0031374A2E